MVYNVIYIFYHQRTLEVSNILATFVILLVTKMNTRLKQFLAAENISQSQFADTINVVRASVSHVLSGRNNPGYDFIKAIMTAYPTLSIEWLILGRGKMYRDTLSDATTAPSMGENSPIYHEPNLFEDFSIPDKKAPLAINEIKQHTEDIPPVSVISQFPQSVPSQRKVVKVTIFFDDGTYQEM